MLFLSLAQHYQPYQLLISLEKKLNKVVLSSNQVLIWDTLQSIGKKDSIDGFGRLFKN